MCQQFSSRLRILKVKGDVNCKYLGTAGIASKAIMECRLGEKRVGYVSIPYYTVHFGDYSTYALHLI